MDQLKKQLAVVLQYGFWIGSAIVLLGSLGVWYLSTSELSRQSDSQIRGIKDNVQKVSNLRSEMSTQPNDKSHEAMKAMISDRESEVLDAWTTVYEAQRRILKWPNTPELPAKFIDEFRHPKDPETGQIDTSLQKLPYEKYVSFPIEDNQKVPQFILRNYERYIDKVLPDVAKIAKAEWTADFKAKRGGMGGPGMMEGMEDGLRTMAGRNTVDITGQKEGPLVAWSTGSQEAVLSDLFPWRGRRPDNLEVYYSQENLWILKQLLEIVAKVNGDARQPFEAKIREIRKLAIGKSVRFGAGSIASPGSNATFGGMEGMEGMEMMMGGEEMLEMGGMSLGATAEKTDPADNRYVNTALEPITGSQLRSAFTSQSPSDANLAVAKRVPVMMSVQIDQRYIPQLMTECGNAPLMVEVKQIRVLPKSKSAAGGMGGMGGMGEMEGEEGEEMTGMGGMGGMNLGAGVAPTQQKQEEFPLDLSVELYGLIYIYNPPDRAALGVDKVDKNTPIEATVEGQTGSEDLPPPTVPPVDTTTPPAAPAAAEPAPPAAVPPAEPAATPAPPPAENNQANQPPAGPVAIGSPAAAASP